MLVRLCLIYFYKLLKTYKCTYCFNIGIFPPTSVHWCFYFLLYRASCVLWRAEKNGQLISLLYLYETECTTDDDLCYRPSIIRRLQGRTKREEALLPMDTIVPQLLRCNCALPLATDKGKLLLLIAIK